jgi:pimeloyl-ACP methyl ester carboxylesterase
MIAGAGHMVQLEASSEVNQILLDYLQDIQQRQLQ